MTTLIIHQTHACAEADLPKLLARLRRTVVKNNSLADHRYWSDAALEALFETTYPELLPAFRSTQVGVQRSDMGRLAVLHHFGGLYIDTDVECLTPFRAPLVGGARLTMAPEPQAQVNALYGGGTYLCNAVMYAPAGDPILTACLQHVQNMWLASGPAMWFTSFDMLGGKLLSRMHRERPDLFDVIPSYVCYPINDLKLKGLPTHFTDIAIAQSGRFSTETQAVHWWVHTNFEGRALINRHGSAWEFLAELYDL